MASLILCTYIKLQAHGFSVPWHLKWSCLEGSKAVSVLHTCWHHFYMGALCLCSSLGVWGAVPFHGCEQSFTLLNLFKEEGAAYK